MALDWHYSKSHGTINEPPLHEAYTATFVENQIFTHWISVKINGITNLKRKLLFRTSSYPRCNNSCQFFCDLWHSPHFPNAQCLTLLQLVIRVNIFSNFISRKFYLLQHVFLTSVRSVKMFWLLSLCPGLLILVLSLFALSALTLTFQLFIRKLFLQISGNEDA